MIRLPPTSTHTYTHLPYATLFRSELEDATARQGLDAQEHLAELAGAAGLVLVPVVALGLRGHGFAVGDARRARGDIDAIALLQPVEVHAQVQVGQAAD